MGTPEPAFTPSTGNGRMAASADVVQPPSDPTSGDSGDRQLRPDARIEAVHVGGAKPYSGPVRLFPYDPEWPLLFEREAARIRAALGTGVRRLEHVGSTSVPGLAAKRTIDILLLVADSADEPSYVPPLERVGYVLRIREPDWHEHRMFKGPDTDVNLHVLTDGHPEATRMVVFRDWLRANAGDRELYERTKRELAAREWKYMQHYADAKTAVVEAILDRADGSSETARGDPT
jgi:GrpB-like predicted nucleotidyltransferase (UPF0157 family)